MSKQNKANNKTKLVNQKTQKLSKGVNKNSKTLNRVAKLEQQRDNVVKNRDRLLFTSVPQPDRLPDCDYPPIYEEKTPKIAVCTFLKEKKIVQKEKAAKKQEKAQYGCSCAIVNGQYTCSMSAIPSVNTTIDRVNNNKNKRIQRKTQLQTALNNIETRLDRFPLSGSPDIKSKLEQRAATLTAAISRFDQKIDQSNTRIEKLQSVKNTLENKSQIRTAIMNSTTNTIAKLDQQISKLATREQELLSEAEKFDSKLNTLNAQITNLGTRAVLEQSSLNHQFIQTVAVNQTVENLLSDISVKQTRRLSSECGCPDEYRPMTIFKNGAMVEYDNECILRCKEGQQYCLTNDCVPSVSVGAIVNNNAALQQKLAYQSKALNPCVYTTICGTDGITYYNTCDLPAGVRIHTLGQDCYEVNRDARIAFDRTYQDAVRNFQITPCNSPNGCIMPLGPRFTYPVPVNPLANSTIRTPTKICVAPIGTTDPSFRVSINENILGSAAWPKDFNGQPYSVLFYGECPPSVSSTFIPPDDPTINNPRFTWPTVVSPSTTVGPPAGSCFSNWSKTYVSLHTGVGTITGLQSNAKRIADFGSGDSNIHIYLGGKYFYGGTKLGSGNFIVGETLQFSNLNEFNGTYKVSKVEGNAVYITCP